MFVSLVHLRSTLHTTLNISTCQRLDPDYKTSRYSGQDSTIKPHTNILCKWLELQGHFRRPWLTGTIPRTWCSLWSCLHCRAGPLSDVTSFDCTNRNSRSKLCFDSKEVNKGRGKHGTARWGHVCGLCPAVHGSGCCEREEKSLEK